MTRVAPADNVTRRKRPWGSRPQQAATRRYGEVLTQLLRSALPSTATVLLLDDPTVAAQLRDWFTHRWAPVSAATWNRNLACLRSACAYWRVEHWITGDPTVGLPRAKLPSNRTPIPLPWTARSPTLLARPKIALRERTLWALLYESAARAHEVTAAAGRHRPGPAQPVAGRYAARAERSTRSPGRPAPPGRWPVTSPGTPWPSVPHRPHRPGNPRAADLDPDTGHARLSYRRAAELFTQATGGWTLHDLRHSALNPRRRRRHARPPRC